MLLKFSIQWEKKSIKFHTETTTTKSEKKRSSRAYGKFHISSTWHLASPFLSPQLPLWLGYEPSSLSPTPLNTQTAAYDRGNESEQNSILVEFSHLWAIHKQHQQQLNERWKKILLHCNQEVVVLSLCCWVSVGKHQRSERTFRVKPRKPLWVSIKEVFKVVETWQKLRKATLLLYFPL